MLRARVATSVVVILAASGCQLIAGVQDHIDLTTDDAFTPVIDGAAPESSAAADTSLPVHPEASVDSGSDTDVRETAPPPEASLPWNCATSNLNGKQYWTCAAQDGNLHECSGGVPVEQSCGGLGCKVNPQGVDDQCFQLSPGWSCASSRGSDGNQYLTCTADGNIHVCEGTTPVEIVCVHGCNHNPVNTNDSCK
jgi:hypothetical protein